MRRIPTTYTPLCRRSKATARLASAQAAAVLGLVLGAVLTGDARAAAPAPTPTAAASSPQSAPTGSTTVQRPRTRRHQDSSGAPKILRQWHGNQFDALRINSAVIYDQAAWRQILGPLNWHPVPKVNFQDSLGVFVTTGGPQPYYGYTITFEKPYREHGALIVPYCGRLPRSGLHPMMIVFPWAVAVIRARDRKVTLRNACPH